MTAPGAPQPPSVDALARTLADTGLPHPLRVEAARRAVSAGDPGSAPAEAARLRRSQLQQVINATGVLLHTNLGRAPLASEQTASYTNLELDLATGRRGSRQVHAGPLLARACGAQDALVLNNGAAAVLLVLATHAADRGVAVSRGELVEIGGGFRIPEVLRQSGATLVEVGTTNRTRLADYLAVAGEVALLLKVHASNYRISGYTGSVDIAELATVGPPVIADLGSGLLDAACPWLKGGPPPWLAGEPAVRQSLSAGASLVTFSGDKLLGGPQAGIIAGTAELVAACARHPLYRALRPGSLVLSALADVATSYLDRRAGELPFWQMATIPPDALRARAEAVVRDVGRDDVTAEACASVSGGGALPGVEIPSWGLRILGDHAGELRVAEPRSIVATVRGGDTRVDLRTVAVAADTEVVVALRKLP